MRRLLLLAVLWCWGVALAADHPEIVQAGFSPDARYHLLLTAYDQDGSGFPVAALQITDVRRGAVVYSVRKTWDTDAGQVVPASTAAALRAGQAAVLARYGLSRPVTGQRLFSVPPLPPLSYPPDRQSTQDTPLGRLRLTPLPLGAGCLSSDHPPRGFELRLGRRVLARATRRPASRWCASGYTLETAWQYRGRLVVIVRSYTQGFEGPDVFPIVVAGRVN